VVARLHEYGPVVAVQPSVQLDPPAAAYWKRTEATPEPPSRAVARSVTLRAAAIRIGQHRRARRRPVGGDGRGLGAVHALDSRASGAVDRCAHDVAAALAVAVADLRAGAARARPPADLEADAMTAMLAGARFGSAAICDSRDVVAHDGAPLPDDLPEAIDEGRPVPGARRVVRLEVGTPQGPQSGLAVALGDGRSLVVLTGELLGTDAEQLSAALLDDVATILAR
jgi:hypothetical protein